MDECRVEGCDVTVLSLETFPVCERAGCTNYKCFECENKCMFFDQDAQEFYCPKCE